MSHAIGQFLLNLLYKVLEKLGVMLIITLLQKAWKHVKKRFTK